MVLWSPAKVHYFSHPAAPLGGRSFDYSAATCWGPRTGWCSGRAAQGNASTGEPRAGSPCRQLGGQVYRHHSNLQSHRHFAQAPEPLPGGASPPADHYSLEQHRGAGTREVVGLFGSPSSSGRLQGTEKQPDAKQAASVPWDFHWWSV